jgi:Fic-DOC domain mobile mystery protein B
MTTLQVRPEDKAVDWGEDPDGATPLTEEQRKGLKLTYIADRAELNEAEAENILLGTRKWQRRSHQLHALLDDKTVRDLHRDMFGEVWRWAGSYRLTDLNIGVDWHQVQLAVRDLTEDAKYWFAQLSQPSVDIAATRFHHRLVQIHPFPNGNGRHARELTDLLLSAAGEQPFTWGRHNLTDLGVTRSAYVTALRAADLGDREALIRFVRS